MLARCTEPPAAPRLELLPGQELGLGVPAAVVSRPWGKPMEKHCLHGDFMGKTHGLYDFGGLETINQWIING